MAVLNRSGFSARSGKGSHRVYSHADIVKTITISGKEGDDAKPYQIKQVEQAIKELKRKKSDPR